MIIEKLNMKDYNEIYELWNNTKGMGLRSLDDSYEGINRFINRNPNTNFVCKINNRIVGVILSGHDGRRGYIYHAVVDNNFRKKGIGKILVKEVINSLKNEGINKIVLVVFKDNKIGNKFWEKIGFELREDLNYRNLSINSQNI